MRFYIASSISNKGQVREVFNLIRTAGHEVSADWTLTDDIPEDERANRPDYMRSIVKRDFEAILESDVFILLTQPAEGRSMYVELGIALTMFGAAKRPLVFAVGPRNTEAAFYFHPDVERCRTVDEVIERASQREIGQPLQRGHEGRLEEYRALRAEMLEILKERTWGQSTYAALGAAVLALTPSAYKVPGLIFVVAIAIPFLFHTIQREHARIRMGNYLRTVLEPQIPGMYWEEYLAIWRGRFGRQERKGWLNLADRTKHILGFAGIYLLVASFSWFLVLSSNSAFGAQATASCFLILLLLGYRKLFKVYDTGAEEYEELWRLNPRG